LVPSPDTLRKIWELHPAEFPEITIHGRLVRIPRWQQAYGRDYRFSGRVNRALPDRKMRWRRRNVARKNALALQRRAVH
jgi:hypothetical protein